MIPLKLQLKNFISYGSHVQTINFEPYHLICLSGKNGHGKSALLDAITWAVWGQARKAGTSAKADEGLLRLGQSHMMVSLDFAAHGLTYRVRREYSVASSKAIAQLDFGVVEASTGHLRSLTDKTIRATQEKINQTIGLDYESFINSAFLRQGHSNEFSKKSARDRKEILATILGLDRYEVIRKRASEKSRLLMSEKEALSKTLESTLAEVQQKTSIMAELVEIEKKLSLVKNDETSINQAHERLQASKKTLDIERQSYTKLTLICNQLSAQIEDATKTFLTKIAAVRALLRQTKSHSSYELEQERQILESKIQTLHKAYTEYRTAMAHIAEAKEKLQALREKLIHDCTLARNTLTKNISAHESSIHHLTQQLELQNKKNKSLDSEVQKITLEIQRLKQELAKTQSLESELSSLEKNFDRRKSFFHKFVTSGNMLKKELTEHSEKKGLLQSAHAQCPLCDQELSEDLCNALKNRLGNKTSLLEHHLKRLARVIKALKDALTLQHDMLTQLKQKQTERHTVFVTLQELEHKHQDYLNEISAYTEITRQLEISLKQSKEQLAQYLADDHSKESPEKLINKNADYKILVDHVQKQELLIQQLAHDEKEYHLATMRFAELTQKNQHHNQILAEHAMLDARKREIREQCLTIKKLKAELTLLKKNLAGEKQIIENEHRIKQEESKLMHESKALSEQKEKLMHIKGGLENHKRILEEKENKIQSERERITHLQETSIEYQAVAQALSKEGIQALLIEESIPEIEEQANILLSKLTDNQAHLTIESLRDLKSGATKETLDIKISDPLGIRPYEMFSGGEAFRIDFALRIAISKLLARRAGATLQLLIIDEGFGSQDEEGLAHIMEALYKIQEDFAKIIIVSHLPSMKDQFPVQFIVNKTPQGSAIRVVEQG